MAGFDVDAARKAGYSDDEILSHLTQTRKFDVAGAERSGYSKADIIRHLTTSSAPASTPRQQEKSLIDPKDTYLPGLNSWLKENHPSIYGAFESLMTAGERGAGQVGRAAEPGRSGAQRVSDVIEGIGTAASPGLLAVPGSGQTARVLTGMAAGALGKGVAETGAGILGADEDTARAVGNVAGLVTGGVGAAAQARLAQAARGVSQIAANPAVRQVAKDAALDVVKDIPVVGKVITGAQRVSQAVRNAREPVPAAAGALPVEMPTAANPGPVALSAKDAAGMNPRIALGSLRQSPAIEAPAPEPLKVVSIRPPRGKGVAQASKDATALADKLTQWNFTPDEAAAMNTQGWAKLAHDTGVPMPTAATQKSALFALKKKLAGPERTVPEMLDSLKKSMGMKDQPTPVEASPRGNVQKSISRVMEKNGELTVDIRDTTPERIAIIEQVAEEMGLNVSSDGKHILIRKPLK